jgi:hypothetical protein
MISFTKFIKEEDDEPLNDYERSQQAERDEEIIKQHIAQEQKARRIANEIPSGAEIRDMLSAFRAKTFPDQTKLNLNRDKRNP